MKYFYNNKPQLYRYFNQLYLSPSVRTISGVAGGNLLASAIAVIGSLVQARYVTPSDLGYFRGFSIATGYAIFLHMGLFDALQRFYPYYIGRGERDRAIAIAEVCQSWNIGISMFLSGGFLVLAAVSLAGGNWRASLGWLAQAVAITGAIYGGYLNATYRSGHDFTSVAKSSVISGALGLFILPLFTIWPYVTLAVRSGLGSLLNVIYLHMHRPLLLQWRFNWREWSDLVKDGLPIFIASYGAATGYSAVEITIILKFLGIKALGLFSMSILFLETVNKIPQAITAVYIPRVTECLGRTGSPIECLRLCRKPLIWGTSGALLMVAGSFASLPLIVPFLMPKYVEAISSMCLMSLFLPIIIFELPYSLLVAMGKVIQQNIAVYTGLVCFIIFSLISIKYNFGLNGVVCASLLGRIVRLIIIYVMIFSLVKSPKCIIAR